MLMNETAVTTGSSFRGASIFASEPGIQRYWSKPKRRLDSGPAREERASRNDGWRDLRCEVMQPRIALRSIRATLAFRRKIFRSSLFFLGVVRRQ
jgi:hypothetical protein